MLHAKCENGCPGWIRAINLPGQSRALSLFELQGNTIRQPELHRSLADTSGVRRSQRFGGIEMVGHLRGGGGEWWLSAGRARTCCPECLPLRRLCRRRSAFCRTALSRHAFADPNGADCCLPRARTRCVLLNGGATGNRTPIYAMPLRRLAIGRWPRNGARARTRTG